MVPCNVNETNQISSIVGSMHASFQQAMANYHLKIKQGLCLNHAWVRCIPLIKKVCCVPLLLILLLNHHLMLAYAAFASCFCCCCPAIWMET
jgi:hypothetical protein